MARKGATQQKNPGRRPAEPVASSPPTRGPVIALAMALLAGIGFAATLLFIHVQMHAAKGGYTSFCDVNSTVGCTPVIGSSYGTLFGLPVAAWALLTYVGLGILLVVRESAAPALRRTLTLGILAAACWILLFSLYMAAIATFRIGHLCPFCFGLYVVAVAAAFLAWRLARAELGPGGIQLVSPTTLSIVGVMVVGLVGVSLLQLAAEDRGGADLTADEVCARDAEFCTWYRKQPEVADLPAAAHVRGDAAAPVTIVEFSDFECPACGMAYRDLHDVERTHAGRVKVVFHHFPLDATCNPHVTTRMHPSACLAAFASECAAREGKFWEYHDRLFTSQEQLGRDALITYATELGIDAAAFTACLDDPATRARVRADTDAGASLGIESTPTLFINGRKISGALDRARYDYAIALATQS